MDQTPQSEVSTAKKAKFPFLLIVLIILALAGVGGSGYFYNKYQAANKLLKNNAAVSTEEAKKITDKIAKFYDLPKGETPEVATVLDTSKLKDQPFFANAKNDDKVIIYQKAGTAILYRPSTNKIIQVSPITAAPSGSPIASSTPKPSTTPKATATAEASPEP